MDVAIFGAGIAGLATAITLRDQGHRCHVYERSRMAQDAGMGFILLPEGVARLESYGVHLAGPEIGIELEGYSCRDAAGEVVFEQPIPSGSKAVRRRDLTAAMIHALGGEDALIYAELSELQFDEEFHVRAAHFCSGASIPKIKADLYVSAEGVNSRARQALFPDWPMAPARVQELVAIVRCDRALEWTGNRLSKFHAAEGGIALGILPVDREHVVWYMQFDSHRYLMPPAALVADSQRRADARHSFVSQLVGKWAHPVPSLLAGTDFTRVHLWRPVDTDLIPCFHRGNLTLVGDSAHPMSPFTSQGVSAAIADAVVLGQVTSGVKSGTELEKALCRYSERRRAECAPYIAKGRQLSANFLKPLSEDSAVLPIALKTNYGEARESF
jgi:2-polyprenyl-6-methoxyphenol hydroxylase-like FAD-dependent oxidoreductase